MRLAPDSQRIFDLAHIYETDLLSLVLHLPGMRPGSNAQLSVLYAVLEAACETLEIARDDIGGAIAPLARAGASLAFFDTVAGGAGHALCYLESDLERVLGAALSRVSTCDCGPETSCYGCLRSYYNQRNHDRLSRGEAQDVLEALLGLPGK